MKTVEFALNGKEYTLLWNANALFAAWDKFGDKGDLMENFVGTDSGIWDNTVWMIVKLAQQGEAWRRYNGEDARPMLTAEDVQRTAGPNDAIRMRSAIRAAYNCGFEREEAKEDEVVDIYLAEWQKKTESALPEPSGSASRPSFLAFLFGKR